MTLTVHNKPDIGTGGAHAALPLLVVRTRVLRVPVDDLLDTIIAALIGDQEQMQSLRNEQTHPEQVLDSVPAGSMTIAEQTAAAMAAEHPEVLDGRQRIKIMRRSA